MKKLYRKSELGFALLWIGIYCLLLSVGDSLSQKLGVINSVSFPIALTLSAILLVFIKKSELMKKYGLCKPCVPAGKMLFYIPLTLLLFANLIYGFNVTLSATEAMLYVLTMLLVGLLEEVIFRGLLFRAMEKDNRKAAVIVSSITFGMGHIINLINGSGAGIFESILQVVYATAAGFMLVEVFLKSKSIIPCIVFHSVFNALSVVVDEAAVTPQKRIVVCVFLVAVSTGYALYLALSGRSNLEKSDDYTSCK